jgi:hypothetical protein
VPLFEIEEGFRDAALREGSKQFTKLLSDMRDENPACSECGTTMRNLGARSKNIVSLLGDGTISRDYYQCGGCGDYAIPKDATLNISNTSFTPGARRVASKLAACDSFENSSAAMAELCGIHVCSKDTERIAGKVGAAIEAENCTKIDMAQASALPHHASERIPIMYIEYDGTGIPVMSRETAGRKGKQEDGSAKTREAKLGCVFTQTGVDEGNNPVRDRNSTTYCGAIETSDAFSRRIYTEAVGRGVDYAEKVVIIGDGAKWIWTVAEESFPQAVQIIDVYHAKEHLWNLIRSLFTDADKQADVKADWYSLLDEGEIGKLTDKMTKCAASNEDKADDIAREINYFTENSARMQYAQFKKHGFFVGSGVIEAGCKNVIGKRLKQSGMHWSVEGANAIIALRCAILSHSFEAMLAQSGAA